MAKTYKCCGQKWCYSMQKQGGFAQCGNCGSVDAYEESKKQSKEMDKVSARCCDQRWYYDHNGFAQCGQCGAIHRP